MSAGTSESVDSIVASYPFNNHQAVVDVGAGDGTFAEALSNHHGHLHVSALDLPNQIAVAADRLGTLENSHRVNLTSADIFTDPLPNADLYTLKGVLHNWPDDSALKILKRIRASSSNARVMVIERTFEVDKNWTPEAP